MRILTTYAIIPLVALIVGCVARQAVSPDVSRCLRQPDARLTATTTGAQPKGTMNLTSSSLLREGCKPPNVQGDLPNVKGSVWLVNYNLEYSLVSQTEVSDVYVFQFIDNEDKKHSMEKKEVTFDGAPKLFAFRLPKTVGYTLVSIRRDGDPAPSLTEIDEALKPFTSGQK